MKSSLRSTTPTTPSTARVKRAWQPHARLCACSAVRAGPCTLPARRRDPVCWTLDHWPRARAHAHTRARTAGACGTPVACTMLHPRPTCCLPRLSHPTRRYAQDALPRVFEQGTAPEGAPWRCARCYVKRHETMAFRLNDAGAPTCQHCGNERAACGWSIWMPYVQPCCTSPAGQGASAPGSSSSPVLRAAAAPI